MFQALKGWISQRSIIKEHVSYQIHRPLADRLPKFRLKLKRSNSDVFQNFRIILSVKRIRSWEKKKKNDSHGPHVALLVVGARENFWSNEIGRSYRIIHRLIRMKKLGTAKIYKFDCNPSFGVHQNDIWFNISAIRRTYLWTMWFAWQ